MRKVYLLLVVLFIGACNSDEVTAVEDNFDSRKVWVFAQLNIPEEGKKIDTYYYYGKISKKLYDKISLNKIHRGFILLSEIKYWKGDNLYEYEDEESTGNLIFRIEDIRKLELIKENPMNVHSEESSNENPEESVPQTEG